MTVTAGLLAGVLVVSLLVPLASAASRVFELHLSEVHLDAAARRFVAEAAAFDRTLRIVINEPGTRDGAAFGGTAGLLLPDAIPILYLEVTRPDTSAPGSGLAVVGEWRHGYRVLRVCSPHVASTIAAVLLHIRDRTGRPPRVYFSWTESHPLAHLFGILFGLGEVTLVTREILLRAEPDPGRRPTVHVS